MYSKQQLVQHSRDDRLQTDSSLTQLQWWRFEAPLHHTLRLLPILLYPSVFSLI